MFGGGLQVTTRLDLSMQREAEKAVAAHLLDGPTSPQAALVAIDPRDGEIRAMYGGSSYARAQVNLATGQGSPAAQCGLGVQAVHAGRRDGAALLARLATGPVRRTITINDPRC